MSSVIEQIALATAKEVIEALSPTGRYFGDDHPDSSWIFRGHSSSEFKLLPASLRPENIDELHQLAGSPREILDLRNTNIGQAYAEAAILAHFYELLDRQGASVPEGITGIADQIRSFPDGLKEMATDESQRVLPDYKTLVNVPLLALARHYQLPTRLLDWSRDAFIAAYFTLDRRRALVRDFDGHAVVWAVKVPPDSHLALGSENQIFVVRAPRSSNPNLHAQNGVFTYHKPFNPELRGDIDRRPLDEIFENHSRLPLGSIRCFQFPREVVPELMVLLAKHGISGSRLFPTPHGAVLEMQERFIWTLGASHS